MAIKSCSGTFVGNSRIIVHPAKESEELFAPKNVASLRGEKSEGCLWQSRSEEGGGGGGGGGNTLKLSGNGTSASRDGVSSPLTHSASTVDDVICQSHDTCPRSDDQSDVDSDSWDEELLTYPFTTDINRQQIPILHRAVSVPVQQPNLSYTGLSPCNTPNDHGLTLVYVSVVINKV